MLVRALLPVGSGPARLRRMVSVERTAHHHLSFAARLLVASAYLAVLFGIAYWAHDGWPPSTAAGLWFYSAGLAVLLSVFISEPFYTSPRVALANGAALALLAITVSRSGLRVSSTVLDIGRFTLIGIGVGIFVISVIAILTANRGGRMNEIAFEISRNIGSGYLLYGLVYIASVYAAFAHDSTKLVVLLVAALAFTWGPVERIVRVADRLRPERRQRQIRVVATEDPGTVIATAPRGVMLTVGDKVTGREGDGVIVDVTQSAVQQQVRAAFSPDARVEIGSALTRTDGAAEANAIVGYAAPGTSMNVLRVAASAAVTDTGIEEGRLVSVPIRGNDVLYQITDAELREDTVASGIHARFEIRAQKLGVWNNRDRSFELIPWIPDPGVPVMLQSRTDGAFDPDGVGVVPGTSYAIRYFPVRAITHNTAILGILGSGKTTLARELVCRNLCADIKVIVLDITNQYASFFDPLITQANVDATTGRIAEAIKDARTRTAQDEDGISFGNRGVFLRAMRAEFDAFLTSDERIRIYNPMAFSVSTIDGFARGGAADLLREATTPEKTSLIATALLMAAQNLGETEEGRVCLVLEEAHSLTPEPTEGLTGRINEPYMSPLVQCFRGASTAMAAC